MTAGVANWLRFRSAAGPAMGSSRSAGTRALPALAVAHTPDPGPDHEDDDGHTIYLDPWAETADPDSPDVRAQASRGPASLP